MSKCVDQSTTLLCRWDKKQKDLMFWFPDGHLLNTVLCGERCHPDPKTQGWNGHTWTPSFVEE